MSLFSWEWETSSRDRQISPASWIPTSHWRSTMLCIRHSLRSTRRVLRQLPPPVSSMLFSILDYALYAHGIFVCFLLFLDWFRVDIRFPTNFSRLHALTLSNIIWFFVDISPFNILCVFFVAHRMLCIYNNIEVVLFSQSDFCLTNENLYHQLHFPLRFSKHRLAGLVRRKRALITFFEADHPFVYAIHAQSELLPLFLGSYRVASEIVDDNVHDEL